MEKQDTPQKTPDPEYSNTATFTIMIYGRELSFALNEVAKQQDQITPQTEIYCGPFFPDFFRILPPDIHFIFSSPSGKPILRETLITGGKKGSEYYRMLEGLHFCLSQGARSILENPMFNTLKKKEPITLVFLTVSDLGFSEDTSIESIYEKSRELGLDLCPPEVAPAYLLHHGSGPLPMFLPHQHEENFWLGMNPIPDKAGNPAKLTISYCEGETWLNASAASPKSQHPPRHWFVFKVRK